MYSFAAPLSILTFLSGLAKVLLVSELHVCILLLLPSYPLLHHVLFGFCLQTSFFIMPFLALTRLSVGCLKLSYGAFFSVFINPIRVQSHLWWAVPVVSWMFQMDLKIWIGFDVLVLLPHLSTGYGLCLQNEDI